MAVGGSGATGRVGLTGANGEVRDAVPSSPGTTGITPGGTRCPNPMFVKLPIVTSLRGTVVVV